MRHNQFISKSRSSLIIVASVLLNLVILVGSAMAETDEEVPVYRPRILTGDNPYLNTSARSLPEARLSNSSYPREAELLCGTEQCVIGLRKNFVVGSDLFGMIATPLRQYFDPQSVTGSFYLLDVFGGVQILQEAKDYMNAQIGYRKLSFDDGVNQIVTQGLTANVNYSRVIVPYFTQSLEFSGFFVIGDASLNNKLNLATIAPDHGKLNDSARYFYRVSQDYPTYRVLLASDLEVANWTPEQTGMRMPLRLYARLAPFYMQNNLSFSDNGVSVQNREQDFGIRVAAVVAYESDARPRRKRFAAKGLLGFDLSGSSMSKTATPGTDIDLPRRPVLAPYFSAAVSYQF